MTTKLLIGAIAATGLALATPALAAAETYTYTCKANHKTSPVKLDMDYATLTWRGTVYRDLKRVVCDQAGYQAISEGVTAELCTATQGVADLTIGKATFECQLNR